MSSEMNFIHIHAPVVTAKTIDRAICHDCKKRTRMLQFYTPWYGWDSTCIRCGRKWEDGEWMELAFVRGSRQKSIDHAKAKWRKVPPISENHYGLDEHGLI